MWRDFGTTYYFLSTTHFELRSNLKASISSPPKMILRLGVGRGNKKAKIQPRKKLWMQWRYNNCFLFFPQVWSQNPGPSLIGHDLSLPERQVPTPSAHPSIGKRMWSPLSASTVVAASWLGLTCPHHHLLKYNFDSTNPAGKIPLAPTALQRSPPSRCVLQGPLQSDLSCMPTLFSAVLPGMPLAHRPWLHSTHVPHVVLPLYICSCGIPPFHSRHALSSSTPPLFPSWQPIPLLWGSLSQKTVLQWREVHDLPSLLWFLISLPSRNFSETTFLVFNVCQLIRITHGQPSGQIQL